MSRVVEGLLQGGRDKDKGELIKRVRGGIRGRG